MSYILEALKKSDQQRQRGATPTLQAAQLAVPEPRRPLFVYYSLLAAVLLGAGIMIGWLSSGQPEQAPPETEPVIVETPILIPQQAAPSPLPVPAESPAVETSPDQPANIAGEAQEQKVPLLHELPLPIQQEIPAMTVQLHGYASKPSERLVSINSIRLREGEYLMMGLRLEQITPEGMIFSYKGYRFQRGIR